MAYKCSFLDNETYSAQDVNDIFARITSGGVVFADTGYTIGDLNTAVSETVTEGVTRDTNSCKVIKDGDTYKISKGACFMNDGSTIIFDEDGQEIEITPGIINYVYLERNIMANSIDIIVSGSAGEEDSIPLAEIDEAGEIFDRRKYSKAKVDFTMSERVRNFTANIPECTGTASETIEVDLGEGAFSYVTIWDGKRTYNGSDETRVSSGKNLVPLVEGEYVTMSIGQYEDYGIELVYCKKDGQKMEIFLVGAKYGAEYTLNMGVI